MKLKDFITILEEQYLFVELHNFNSNEIKILKLYFKILERHLKHRSTLATFFEENKEELYFYLYFTSNFQDKKQGRIINQLEIMFKSIEK